MTGNICSVSFCVINIPRVRSICGAKLMVGEIFPKNGLRESNASVRACPTVLMIYGDAASSETKALSHSRCRYVLVILYGSLATNPTAALRAVAAYYRGVFETIVTVYISTAVTTVYHAIGLCCAQIINGIGLKKKELFTTKVGSIGP